MSLIWIFIGLLAIISGLFFLKSNNQKAFIFILISISLAISLQISKTAFPDDTAVITSTPNGYVVYAGGRSFNQFNCKNQNTLIYCQTQATSIKLNVKYNQVFINNQKLSKKYYFYDKMLNSIIIKIKSRLKTQLIMTSIILIVLLIIIGITKNYSTESPIYQVAISANNLWKSFSTIKKTCLILFPIIFCTSTTGVDLANFHYLLQLNKTGIDIYFYQSILRLGYWNMSSAPFPYPIIVPSMFTPFLALFSPLFHLIHIGQSQLFNQEFTNPQFFPLKITIYFIYLISALIFASNIEIPYTSKKKLFYAFFFFPVSFYISGFYGHIDAVTLFFLVIALALLFKKKSTGSLIIIVILLLATKIQAELLIPALCVPFFFIWNQKISLKNKTVLEIIQLIGIFAIMFCVTIILPLINTNVIVTLFDYPVNNRIWFTTIPYAPQVFFFFSIFAFLASLVALSTLIEKSSCNTDLLIATSFGIAITSAWFSSTILFTHSFLSVIAPAFALVIASPKIPIIRKIFISIFSVGILVNLIFCSQGDISRIFFQENFFSTEESIQLVSLTHTIAVSSLFLVGVILYQSFDYLKSSSEKYGYIKN